MGVQAQEFGLFGLAHKVLAENAKVLTFVWNLGSQERGAAFEQALRERAATLRGLTGVRGHFRDDGSSDEVRYPSLDVEFRSTEQAAHAVDGLAAFLRAHFANAHDVVTYGPLPMAVEEGTAAGIHGFLPQQGCGFLIQCAG